ncbi:MAG: protein kinase [Bauldia sp.]|uniref:protein kinase domain-containing protein n=1 Tax=Bauldia sp. TaxID=2575872 RepID=UPI001D29F3C5|nr:protein kinase [Bauldia sp.]MCB1497033.1 protein kinase [Bauldia sp.]
MTDDDRLAELDRRIAALEDPSALLEAADAMADVAGGRDEAAVRLGVARGIIFNRLGLPESALKELQRARALARDIGATTALATISRETSRIHTWRGETSSAALELLRSVVEADIAGSRADSAAAIAEFGRLNLDTGRYEAALDAFALAGRVMDILPPREASRIPVNRLEALLALGRHDECLAGIDALIASLPEAFARDNFLARVVKARSLAALGEHAAARAAMDDAARWLGEDPSSYERAELDLLEGALDRKDDPERAVAEIESALDRFVDDDLPRHEFDARILLAETLAALDRQAEAEACIVEALRRAAIRQLPAMADRVRAAAVGFWRPAMIAELSPEDRVGPEMGSGRFLVLETLGAGGFGEVQRAIDLDTGTEVAIKRLRRQDGLDPQTARAVMATARNEIVSSAQIRARGVAKTRYLHMDPAGALTLVQDYVEGPTLGASLDDGSLDRSRRLTVAATVARTLAALHREGVAHRDLKPDNIILRNNSQPVIIDLGIARLKGLVDTVAGLGTERYAPPEQMSGRMIEDRWLGREDVYALGRMLGEMLDDDDAPERRGGLLGRFGRRRAEPSDGSLREMMATMTAADIARRDVDLNRLADLLDDAAIEAGS